MAERKKKFVPTEEQKVNALGTVFYEITMLGNSLKCWGIDARVAEWEQRLILNAVLESLLIHARILITFLTTPVVARHEDDILAHDYGFRIERDDSLVKLSLDINKHLAHLTYTRSDRKKEDWQSLPFEHLLSHCGAFLRSLKQASWVGKLDEHGQRRWKELSSRLVLSP